MRRTDGWSLIDIGWRRRRRIPELMDRDGLDDTLHASALRGLGRINRISRSASIVWPSIAGLARAHPGRSIRVLDIASGGGDVPIRLARLAVQGGLDVQVEGCDVSPTAVAFAEKAAREAGVDVRFFRLDALNDPMPEGYNVLMCSLFLHHLGEDEAVSLLGKMARASESLILVNDLVRSRIGYGLAWAGCRILSRSPIVHHDGPASVRSAFRRDEVRALAERAGLQGARLERRWPRRFLLTWSRDPS